MSNNLFYSVQETDLPPPYALSIELSSLPQNHSSAVTSVKYYVSKAPPPYTATEANSSEVTSSATSNQVTDSCSNRLRQDGDVSAEAQSQFTTAQFRPDVFSVSRNVLPINATNRFIDTFRSTSKRAVPGNEERYSSQQLTNLQETGRWYEVSFVNYCINQVCQFGKRCMFFGTRTQTDRLTRIYTECWVPFPHNTQRQLLTCSQTTRRTAIYLNPICLFPLAITHEK